MESLNLAAYVLCQEVRDKKWDNVASLKAGPVPSSSEIVDELRQRCPGHTVEEYREAIAQGMFESLW